MIQDKRYILLSIEKRIKMILKRDVCNLEIMNFNKVIGNRF